MSTDLEAGREAASRKQLYAALIKAQSEMLPVKKSGHNKHQDYRYPTLGDLCDASSEALKRNGLCLTSSVDSVEQLPDRTTARGGTEYAVRVHMTHRLAHESGEWIDVCCPGEGQDFADKAGYKATTGGRKYGMSLLLKLATTDDPEADESVGQADQPRGKKRGKPRAPRKTPEPSHVGTMQDRYDKTSAEIAKVATDSKKLAEYRDAITQKAAGYYTEPQVKLLFEEIGSALAAIANKAIDEKATDEAGLLAIQTRTMAHQTSGVFSAKQADPLLVRTATLLRQLKEATGATP